jgi:hypothetical protein
METNKDKLLGLIKDKIETLSIEITWTNENNSVIIILEYIYTEHKKKLSLIKFKMLISIKFNWYNQSFSFRFISIQCLINSNTLAQKKYVQPVRAQNRYRFNA